jgi:hypothetical protein
VRSRERDEFSQRFFSTSQRDTFHNWSCFFLLYGFESDMRKDLVRREREEVEMRGFEVECGCNEGKKIDKRCLSLLRKTRKQLRLLDQKFCSD